MADEFVPDFDLNAVPPNLTLASPNPHRERIRLILIGPIGYLRDMQLYLANCGVAEVGDWSRLLPSPDSSEMMSILIRYRIRQD
jgi:hypothetical protein